MNEIGKRVVVLTVTLIAWPAMGATSQDGAAGLANQNSEHTVVVTGNAPIPKQPTQQSAQATVSLDALIQEALENNPSIQSSARRVEALA